MLPTATKDIGGHTYTTTALPADGARKLLVRVSKALAAGTGGLAEGKSIEAAVVLGLANVIKELPEDLFLQLCDEFSKYTTVTIDSRSLPLANIFSLHFACKYDELLEWLYFCFDFNFGSILKKAKGLIGEAVQTPMPGVT